MPKYNAARQSVQIREILIKTVAQLWKYFASRKQNHLSTANGLGLGGGGGGV